MPTEQTNTVQRISTAWLSLNNRFSTFRWQSLRNYRYVIGDQIDKATLDKLEKEKRPALAFNLLMPLIIYIAGVLSQERRAMKAVPVRHGDEIASELHTVLVNDFGMANCDGLDEIVKAGLDAIIGKVGWLSNYWTTRDNPEGKWITEAADPFTILWDPDGRKEDQSDWRFMAVSGFYSAEEIMAMLSQDLSPEMAGKLKEEAERLEGRYKQLGKAVGWVERVATGLVDTQGRPLSTGERTNDSLRGLVSDFVDARNGIYRTIEWHERRSVTGTFVYSPVTRDMQRIPDEKVQDREFVSQMQTTVPDGRIQTMVSTELWVTTIVPGLLPNDIVLEKPYPVQGEGFQHKPIFCYSLHPDLTQTTSVVDGLISPLDSYNQRRMTMLEYIMDTVNPRIDAPKNSIDALDLDAWESKERGIIRLFTPIGGEGPKADRPVVDKVALQVFAEEDRDLVQKLSGVTPNMQGYRESSNEPASLFAQRVQQGMIVMEFFNSHVKRTMQHVFTYCDRNLQEFMTFPRMVRLLSEPPPNMPGILSMDKGTQMAYWIQLNWPTLQGMINDVSQGEYDFKADTTQIGATAKQMKFLEAMEFIKALVQSGAPAQAIKHSALFKLWDSPIAKEMQEFFDEVTGAVQVQQQIAAREQAEAAALSQATGEAALLEKTGLAAQKLDPMMQAQRRVAV